MPARIPLSADIAPATARKRAQRAVPMGPCSRCGSRQDVQRHHANLSTGAVKLLCKRCHVRTEMAAGGWGTFKAANMKSLRAANRRGVERN